jgi:hypothetical protein
MLFAVGHRRDESPPSGGAMFIGLSLIFIGIVFLLERLDIIPIGIGQLWPVFIILFGLGLLADRLKKRR